MRTKGVYQQYQMWLMPAQHHELKVAAALANRKMTELVRDAIHRYLHPAPGYGPAATEQEEPEEVREP